MTQDLHNDGKLLVVENVLWELLELLCEKKGNILARSTGVSLVSFFKRLSMVKDVDVGDDVEEEEEPPP